MPDQPSQLPKQQFSAANADTRSQTRISRLEDRVRQLEQGKQLIQTPMFTWSYEQSIVSTTSQTWRFSIPMPPAVRDPGDLVKTENIFMWFELPVVQVGGTVSADVSLSTAATSATWSWTSSGAGQQYLYPNTASTTIATTNARSTFIPFRLVTDSPSGAAVEVSLSVVRTSATNSFTLGASALGIWPRVYAIIPPSFTS